MTSTEKETTTGPTKEQKEQKEQKGQGSRRVDKRQRQQGKRLVGKRVPYRGHMGNMGRPTGGRRNAASAYINATA